MCPAKACARACFRWLASLVLAWLLLRRARCRRIRSGGRPLVRLGIRCSLGVSGRGYRKMSGGAALCMRQPGCGLRWPGCTLVSGRLRHRLGLVAGGQAQARVDDGVDAAVAGYDQTRQHALTGEGKAPWLVAFAVVLRLERLARPLRFFGGRSGC